MEEKSYIFKDSPPPPFLDVWKSSDCQTPGPHQLSLLTALQSSHRSYLTETHI